jgi:hypothetical protein
MGFRFRRSVRLAPGLRLNLSKSGPSLSVGGRGATVNISKKGTRTTLSIPGAGISYQTGYFRAHRHNQAAPTSPPVNLPALNQPGSASGRITKGFGICLTVLAAAGCLIWANSGPDSTSRGLSPSVATTADGTFVESAKPTVAPAPEPSTQAIQADPHATVTVLRTANIRSGPSVKDPVVGVVKAGDRLEMVSRAHGWVEVQMHSGIVWIAGSLVD